MAALRQLHAAKQRKYVMLAIIDYDAGNMKSVEKAVQYLGEEVVLTDREEELLSADRVILPGVGSFGAAMESLRRNGLDKVIRKVVENNTPFLGICLGMQMLFDESEESPGVEGLHLLPGKILRIPETPGLKIPHMGWNSLHFPKETRLFAGLPENTYTYFVHSYYLQADDPDVVAAVTDYGIELQVAVEYGYIFGCQFHPEKSSKDGLAILRNFLNVEKEG